MSTNQLTPEEEPVCTAWPRLVQMGLVVFLAITGGILVRYWVTPDSDGMQQQINPLTPPVAHLEQNHSTPASGHGPAESRRTGRGGGISHGRSWNDGQSADPRVCAACVPA